MRSYGLDPAHYYTLPGYTWDAMLKYTGVRFELLTDIDMVMFVERGIRGGLSQCSDRYARANNKYVQSYNPSEPSSYLMYFDVNNLYGWAMCQSLPYEDFRWVENVTSIDLMSVMPDSPIGYIVEVDLAYPPGLHDSHADFPFCPTRDKPPGKRRDKLLATLRDKRRYVTHYLNLQQCIRHGLRVTRIHRILRFAQSPWLRGYIELNTRLRVNAKNEFEKNLYKLMNNAVFGKTMENVRNHSDVRLVTRWDGRFGAETMIAKPNFHSRSVFAEDLVAVELRKLEIKFYKPIYRRGPRVLAQRVDNGEYVVVAFVESRVRTHLDHIRLPQVVVPAHRDAASREVSPRGRVQLLHQSSFFDAHSILIEATSFQGRFPFSSDIEGACIKTGKFGLALLENGLAVFSKSCMRFSNSFDSFVNRDANSSNFLIFSARFAISRSVSPILSILPSSPFEGACGVEREKSILNRVIDT
ncbi:hypothetical protein ACFW04_013453 [Cataglyphis niger]